MQRTRFITAAARAALIAGAMVGCQAGPETASVPAGPGRPEATAPARPVATATAPRIDPPAKTVAAPLEPVTEAQRLLDEPARRVVRLSNGLTLILQQNKTAPVVSTRMVVRAGSLTEGPHTGAGISHLVEHLVASANSGKRQQTENTMLLLKIGNDSNAYTEADETSYFITTTPDKFPVAAELLIDLTTNSAFGKPEFEREYQVVQRELEMDQAQSDWVFYAQALANRYTTSAARMPVVGFKAAMQTLTLEDCQAYYRQMYVPDNMILSIAGDIDIDASQTFVMTQMQDVRRRPAPPLEKVSDPPVTAPRVSVAHADITEARIQWAFPTPAIDSADGPALEVLANALGAGDSSPLVRELRERRGLVVQIAAAQDTPRYAAGSLQINATLDPAKIPAAQEAVLGQIDALLKDGAAGGGITDADLTRAKAQAAAASAFNFQSAEQQATRNANDFMVSGGIDFSSAHDAKLKAVTREQVLAAARTYLTREHLLTTLLLPLKAKNPFAAVPSADAGGAARGSVIRKVLPNGVTLLISRNPAAPIACFNLYTLGGLLAEDDGNSGIGTVMMNLMVRQTTQRTHAQITEFLDATGTSVSGTSGDNAFQISMATLKEHAAEAFGVFADMALHPRFTAEELTLARRWLITAPDIASEEWSEEAFRVLRHEYYASSPYRRTALGAAEVTDKLTPGEIQAHYQEYFLDPAHLVIAISGDIDPAAAESWAAPFADIRPHVPTLNLFSITNDPRVVVRPTDREAATVMIAYPGSKMDTHDRDALTLLKTYLGGYSSPSGSLLHDTLRSRGLVYTVKATSIPGPAGGMFLIRALGEPQNAQTIAATIQDLIERVKKGNVPAALFEAARDQAVTGKMLDQPTVAEISAHQALGEMLGVGYDDDAKFPDRARGITREEMIRIANKYLTTPTVVILTPGG